MVANKTQPARFDRYTLVSAEERAKFRARLEAGPNTYEFVETDEAVAGFTLYVLAARRLNPTTKELLKARIK
jgi:hypothetical protein